MRFFFLVPFWHIIIRARPTSIQFCISTCILWLGLPFYIPIQFVNSLSPTSSRSTFLSAIVRVRVVEVVTFAASKASCFVVSARFWILTSESRNVDDIDVELPDAAPGVAPRKSSPAPSKIVTTEPVFTIIVTQLVEHKLVTIVEVQREPVPTLLIVRQRL